MQKECGNFMFCNPIPNISLNDKMSRWKFTRKFPFQMSTWRWILLKICECETSEKICCYSQAFWYLVFHSVLTNVHCSSACFIYKSFLSKQTKINKCLQIGQKRFSFITSFWASTKTSIDHCKVLLDNLRWILIQRSNKANTPDKWNRWNAEMIFFKRSNRSGIKQNIWVHKYSEKLRFCF